jgi:hypothetical protein
MTDLVDLFDQVNDQLKQRGGSIVEQETGVIAAFPGFKAALRIEDADGQPIAVMTIAGNAAIIAEAVKWTADAFKEDQER